MTKPAALVGFASRNCLSFLTFAEALSLSPGQASFFVAKPRGSSGQVTTFWLRGVTLLKRQKRHPATMSAILSADDLNDFISPGVACIKPVETLPQKDPKETEVSFTGVSPQSLRASLLKSSSRTLMK